MPRVIHFEISADDPKRAKKFYEKVFGWKINKWEGPVDYWLIITGDKSEAGIDGAIKRGRNLMKALQTPSAFLQSTSS